MLLLLFIMWQFQLKKYNKGKSLQWVIECDYYVDVYFILKIF